MAAAAEWWFYHIEHTSLDAAIAPLVEKCLERKWRVLVVGHEETLERLDKGLWTWREDSFLPHGRARTDAKKQPVLLSTEADPANGAKVAVLLDGSDAEPGLFERCMVVFDGGDDTARAKARQQFKAASDGGAVARYFQQERNGGWKEFKREEKPADTKPEA
ncbi:MAG TPA: DNA polymerase III subunit chi [Hyphomonadaceae bacterium]|nr:DNA polymerase III subunit chi [Hyphomonadaceae bacterium]